MKKTNARVRPMLLLLSVVYCLCSLAHFVHNAEFLGDYPNMPASIERSEVYLTWLGITGLGIVGLLLAHTRFAGLGLLLVAVYSVLGFDGLAHYLLAPLSSHTAAMNLTIWAEVLSAAVLLAFVTVISIRHFGRGRHGAANA